MKTKCLHYAYPSSPTACKYGFANEGCYYVTVAEPMEHHKARPYSQIWPGTPKGKRIALDWLLNRLGVNLEVDRHCMSRGMSHAVAEPMKPLAHPDSEFLKVVAGWAKKDTLVAMPLDEEAPGRFGLGFIHKGYSEPTPFKPEVFCFASMKMAEVFVRKIKAL